MLGTSADKSPVAHRQASLRRLLALRGPLVDGPQRPRQLGTLPPWAWVGLLLKGPGMHRARPGGSSRVGPCCATRSST
ncbi:hypothetical protein AERO9AM_60053 [Aeromicrobium sp. 9AM]|nr:hypothetical protein AERO9AM_60053 [Aeromicrobium sp. 9AM]